MPDWDLLVILSYLMSDTFEPLESVPLAQLTIKTCFLVMLATARRVSEVTHLSGLPGDVAREADGSITLQFLPEFLAKNQKPETPSPSITIPPLSDIISRTEPDIQNCPVRALNVYRRRTRNIRSPGQRALFLSLNPQYNQDIRVLTISRWMKSLILDAYIQWGSQDSVSPHVLELRRATVHEIRKWSTSVAAHSVPLPKVLQAAAWENHDVFTSFYLRDVARRRENGLWGLPSIVAAQSTVPASL